MKLTDYIFGSRRGSEANAIERKAMTDPFLAEALDGYDEVYGDHADRLASLSQRVTMASHKRPAAGGGKRGRLAAIYGGIAAAAAVIGLTLFIFIGRQPDEDQLIASADTVPGRTEAPLPPSALRGNTPATEPTTESVPVSGTDSGTYPADAAVQQADAVNTANLSVMVSDDSLSDEEMTEEAPTVTEDLPMAEENMAVETAVATAETFMSAEACAEAVAVDAMPKAAMAETHMLTRSAPIEPAPAVKVSEANPEFEKYWIENRLVLTLGDGTPLMGDIVVEFEVNDAGIPSSIRIVSGLSRDSNREVIDMLVSGPRWTPTAGGRITVVLTY